MPIDQLSKADLPALRRLAQACLDADGGLPLLTETAMLRSRFLRKVTVAIREDGELLAAAGLDVDGDRAITSGMVAPSVRGRGLGTHLLTWAEDGAGKQRNYLASEPAFQFVKSLQARNMVIPVVGDLSGRGAIVGIGRWIALRTRSPISSTQERIKVGVEAGLLSADEAAQLAYAHEQVYELLFESQIASLRAGESVSTWIDPKSVDSLRRRHLRQSFKAISHLQERLEAEWTVRR